MKELSTYLDKIKKSVNDKSDTIFDIQRCIAKASGQKISKNLLSIEKETLFISVSSVRKNELFLKKKAILSLFKEEGISITNFR